MQISEVGQAAREIIADIRKSYESATKEIEARTKKLDVEESENLSATSEGKPSFGVSIREAVEQVNNLQTEANSLAEKFAVGDPVDTHEVMLAMQKASLALQLSVQVRNKVIEAYQEIMRMQI